MSDPLDGLLPLVGPELQDLIHRIQAERAADRRPIAELDELAAELQDGDPALAQVLAVWGTRNDPHALPWALFVRVVAPHVAARCQADPQGTLALRLAWRNRIWTTRDTLCFSEHVQGAPVPDALALAEREDLDPHTATLVLDDAVRFIDHAMHELPHGVLSGMNGATPDELRDLLAWLDQLERLVGVLGRADEHRARLDHARFHTAAYLSYLESEDPSGGFEAYLAEHAQDPGADAPR